MEYEKMFAYDVKRVVLKAYVSLINCKLQLIQKEENINERVKIEKEIRNVW